MPLLRINDGGLHKVHPIWSNDWIILVDKSLGDLDSLRYNAFLLRANISHTMFLRPPLYLRRLETTHLSF
jgi:hypothetical protein